MQVSMDHLLIMQPYGKLWEQVEKLTVNKLDSLLLMMESFTLLQKRLK